MHFSLGLLAVLGFAGPVFAGPKEKCDRSYDYIIVGGGTAGAALAARLSQSLPTHTILLLEAGPAAPLEPRINIPGFRGSTLGTLYDWNFTSVPQPHARDRVFSFNRGRVLGGSSALNLMSYDRASVAEYNAWGEALGNEGWGWEGMIGAMMKAENFTGRNTDTYGEEGVGDSGPVRAVVNRYVPEHQHAFIPTVEGMGLGIQRNLESLGGNPLGVMFQPSSIDPGPWTRSYSANAYLPLAGPNLDILADTTVEKITFKKHKKIQKATGVTLRGGGCIKARKEVILSAGSIQSPGLLEVSGIGKKSVLKAARVKQLVDLPGVGENLQDHLRIQSSYQLKPGFTSFDEIRINATYAAEQLALWNAGETGAYDYTGSGYAFMNWEQVLDDDSRIKSLAKKAVGRKPDRVRRAQLGFLDDPSVPQLEVIFSDGYTGVKGYPPSTSPLFGNQYFTLIAGIMHPLSRGSIHINPSDPHGKPLIDPRFLEQEHDVEALIQAIKFCRHIATSEPLASLWVDEYEPGLHVQTDSQWRDFVYNTTLSIFHPVGTCAMLPRREGGVVDARLRVYGTEGLRVVDASVIPVLISAHIQTAVYGIAEIAADLIIGDA